MYCQKRGRRNRNQQQNYYLTSPNLLPSGGNSISPPSAIHTVMGNTTNRQTKTADVIYFVPFRLTF